MEKQNINQTNEDNDSDLIQSLYEPNKPGSLACIIGRTLCGVGLGAGVGASVSAFIHAFPYMFNPELKMTPDTMNMIYLAYGLFISFGGVMGGIYSNFNND